MGSWEREERAAGIIADKSVSVSACEVQGWLVREEAGVTTLGSHFNMALLLLVGSCRFGHFFSSIAVLVPKLLLASLNIDAVRRLRKDGSAA